MSVSQINHPGPPIAADGLYLFGDVVVDSNGVAWVCSTSGTPGGFSSPLPGAVPTVKRAMVALGGDGAGPVNGYVTPTNSDVCMRKSFTLDENALRFRFRIRNSRPGHNDTNSGAITIDSISMGTPSFGNQNQWWDSSFTTAPTQLLAPGSTELGTSEYVSPWIAPSTFALVKDKLYGFSMGFRCPGVQVSNGQTPGWTFVGTGSSSAATAAAVPGTTAQPYLMYLDVRLEYEVFTAKEHLAVFGASRDDAWLDTISPSVAAGHMGDDNCWPAMAGHRLRHIVTNASIGGQSVSSWASQYPNGLLWTRMFSPESGYTALATTPDYAVIGDMVVNDSPDQAGFTLLQATNNFATNLASLIAHLNALGMTRIFACTSAPGYLTSLGANVPAYQGGQLNTAIPAGAFTSVKVTQKLAFGFNGGPPGQLSSWVTGSGGPWRIAVGDPYSVPIANISGPLAVTLAGSSLSAGVLTLVASGTAPAGGYSAPNTAVLTMSEFNRQSINKFVRSLPPGLEGVLEFDQVAMSDFYWPKTQGRPEFFSNDGDAHPISISLYAAYAACLVAAVAGT